MNAIDIHQITLTCYIDILNTVEFDLCLPHVGEFTELYLHFHFQNKTMFFELVHKVQGIEALYCVYLLSYLDLLYSAPTTYLNLEYSLLSVSAICAAASLNMSKPSNSIIEWGIFFFFSL
jgi:hypothetical protein